jgi:hypothetical protein
MSFLSISGLKKAYESLEGEFSKTFDSTRGTGEPQPPPESSADTPAAEETPSTGGGEEREGGEEEDSWGNWETQDKGGEPSKKR